MPLSKSPSAKAFSKNIGAELRAGRPFKQAIAIAYAVKRKASKKKKGGTMAAKKKAKKSTKKRAKKSTKKRAK